ncbi:hypothetical protein FOTG_18851 [Fusarium oxysporum f. sp. vasinfectum 25433]|uniref:Uncharacterized protein n=1 Tax=Fusarium oxysporum f. sp. vasinfectum 25433 TaxID=1089449 RepID=X0KVF5_FUSOX|nr:hypothetical protein FOTG_18851 [Fusarium oxysporum f. sp. vasinfectum 25433]
MASETPHSRRTSSTASKMATPPPISLPGLLRVWTGATLNPIR